VEVPTIDVVELETGLTPWAPYLDGPPEDPEMVEEPVVERTRDHLVRVVAEVVEHRQRRIASHGSAMGSDPIERALVQSGKVAVRLVAERSEEDSAIRMERDARRDVRMARHEVDDRTDLGLARWIRSGTALLRLQPPTRREVP